MHINRSKISVYFHLIIDESSRASGAQFLRSTTFGTGLSPMPQTVPRQVSGVGQLNSIPDNMSKRLFALSKKRTHNTSGTADVGTLLYIVLSHGPTFHNEAMLAASQICPWLAAPSPYMATATGVSSPAGAEYLLAKASPVPTGTCAPTIPFSRENQSIAKLRETKTVQKNRMREWGGTVECWHPLFWASCVLK